MAEPTVSDNPSLLPEQQPSARQGEPIVSPITAAPDGENMRASIAQQKSRSIAPLGKPENERSRGKLKIFFSYAPGTGKTLAMLQDAYRRAQQGVDVVIGFVEARQDLLTLPFLEKLETLPQTVVAPSGIHYQGMNLDLLLARRAQVVLVDHLAHANPPGLRHVARYLEIDELLNAGMDVYTTLNIYEIESQIDAVANLTGLTAHETVPDRFLDEADQIEVVDLPPQALLEHYQAGKIFSSPRMETQMQTIFAPGNLFALRELALRYVAQRSTTLLRGYMKEGTPQVVQPGANHLLVCMSAGANSARLVRAGRRMADETNAAWTVLYVETPATLEHPPKGYTAESLRLAEMLGATTKTVIGRSVSEAVREYVRTQHIQHVLIGRSSHKPWYNLTRPFLAEQLAREDPSMNVSILGSDYIPRPFELPRLWKWMSGFQLIGSLALVLLPTLLGLALTPTVISRSANLVMLYLLAVVIASIFFGLLPALLTALLSALAFDFFFIPHPASWFGFAPENAITFISLLVVSIIISTLVSRERMLTKTAQSRAEQVSQLYTFSRDLAIAVDMPDIFRTVIAHVEQTFQRDMVIFLPKGAYLTLSAASSQNGLESGEVTAAEWAFQQGRPAGYHTGTFSYARYRYFPLETSRGIIGVMGVCLAGNAIDMHPEQMRQLSAYVTKAASAIERALFAEEASQTEILRATDKLQTALLNSISHDLRTPLASITGVLDSLRMEGDFLDAAMRAELVETAFEEAQRLNRLVGNLLDMTRLEAGTLRLSIQPCDVQDLIGTALNALTNRLEAHPVNLEIDANLPLAPFDFVLINQVMINLIENAIKYSPENGPIDIRAEQNAEWLQIEVCDRGPGIPTEDLERIFEKFYRVKRFEHVVGTGLGLSICQGIVEVHGGKIWAENRPGGGGKFIFTLPFGATRRIDPDTHDLSEQPEEQRAGPSSTNIPASSHPAELQKEPHHER